MTTRPLLALCAVTVLAACPKDISSDDRLERESRRDDSSKSDSAGELKKLRCDDAPTDLAKARDEKRTEDERLNSYIDLYERMHTRSVKFEEAMSRNPDLAYQDGNQDLVTARDQCIQTSADVKLEAETLVREVMQMLVVEDVRGGGQAVKVARLNFERLRNAIDKLEMDDRDALFTKISNAEKQVEVKAEARKRSR